MTVKKERKPPKLFPPQASGTESWTMYTRLAGATGKLLGSSTRMVYSLILCPDSENPGENSNARVGENPLIEGGNLR